MANTNDAQTRRFNNGGIITITPLSGSAYIVIYVKDGELEWNVPGKTPIPVMDRGDFKHVLAGSKRPITGKFAIAYTSIAGATDVWTLLATDPSTGLKKQFSMEIKIFTADGAATYDKITFANCFLPDGFQYKADGGDQGPDVITLPFQDQENAPTIVAV